MWQVRESMEVLHGKIIADSAKTGACPRLVQHTVDLCCVRISSFAVDDSVGWLVQVSLTFFAFTGSARLTEGVNANSVRLTSTSQPTESSTAKLEIRTQHKSAVAVTCNNLTA